ncbi:MAG: hypothetical protein ACR2H3_06165 [Acidimicrobiales bacterium]
MRVYRVSSPIGEVIESVLNVGDTADIKLRNAVGTGADKILDRVRELVCL